MKTIVNGLLLVPVLAMFPRAAEAQVTYPCMGCYNIPSSIHQGCTTEDPPVGIAEECIVFDDGNGTVFCNQVGSGAECPPDFAFSTLDEGKRVTVAGTFVPLMWRSIIGTELVRNACTGFVVAAAGDAPPPPLHITFQARSAPARTGADL